MWGKMQSASLPKEGWVEVGRKGSDPPLSVQMKRLPHLPQSVLFRIINLKTGRVAVEPWVVDQDLIGMLYVGLLTLRSKEERMIIRR
jgi:hypothetical protein